MKPKSSNRFRVCGTPSKTGCITCKIRRVKCGEEKPFCKRCTSTGRNCDGYAPPKAPDSSSRRSTPRSISKSPRYISGSPEAGPMEQRLLYFFRTFTAPKLSGYFSADFWERRVFQASNVEPSIQHAVTAIAAIHQDFVGWHQNKVLDPSIQAFAFRLYTQAISRLHQLMSTQSLQLDMTLIACICFITFDCLLGNHESAIIHLRAGLTILEDIKLRKSPCAHEWEREFAPLLLSLGTQAASFANLTQETDRSSLWMALRNAGISNPSYNFQTLDEARHSLDSLAADITVDRGSSSKWANEQELPSPIGPDNLMQMASIIAWTEGLDKFLSEPVPEGSATANKIRLGASLLKCHSLVYSIVIESPGLSEGKFHEVLRHCEYLVNARSSSPFPNEDLSFTADMGLIAPLFFTILQAPNPTIQQRAIDLLSRASGREGMWDANDALRIVGDVIGAPSQNIGLAIKPFLTSPTVPPSDARMRNIMSDRMIWPFGERCEYSSPHMMPSMKSEPAFSSPYLEPNSAVFPSPQTTPQFVMQGSSTFACCTQASQVPVAASAPQVLQQPLPSFDWVSFP
ncbi:uncharacterized protein BP5553_03280 [Venustampulla echinocandica]|uniref:Zn(2)-C6 fungal-type domain-containing protein n=1 Tax=Venustampulla echinocandica TaxID=2656787 RepID=A0A370TTV2_9HELO|nr:uncharacterized protein BP5553_03280 [Venustampulla echinocandica]RDL38940.1 hypothetical protein BP5553_03280 [Venustampulla echinocandica]